MQQACVAVLTTLLVGVQQGQHIFASTLSTSNRLDPLFSHFGVEKTFNNLADLSSVCINYWAGEQSIYASVR
jgi:hypothetical protein